MLITYTKDWEVDDLNEGGTIKIESPNGSIEAVWMTSGGKGSVELVKNNTGLSDEEALEYIENPDICQGYGEYEVVLPDFPGSPAS